MDRYSRIVRWLRIILPLAALALLLAVFLLPRELLVGRIGLSGLSFDPGQGLRLESPRFSGTTPDGQPFAVTADWALPDAPDPTRIDLGPLAGEFVVEPGQTVRLTAEAGEYRPKDGLLSLDGGVVVTTSDGYRMTAARARADIDARTLRVEGPVAGEGALGRIEADSMRAVQRDGENHVWFEGNVRVRIVPGAPAP
jgi:lipopolysaccharide export system protein LptC